MTTATPAADIGLLAAAVVSAADPEMLALEFECQAEWRRSIAEEFPDDRRNLEAAALWDRLARSVTDCPAEVLDAAWELFDDHSGEDWSQMKRTVGFYYFPESAENLLRDFIADQT